MIRAYLTRLIDGLPSWTLALIVGFSGWAFSILLYAPALWLPIFGGANIVLRVDCFINQCANPLAREHVDPILYYRITTPLLAWLLGLKGLWVFSIQYLSIPVSLALIFLATVKRTDRVIATYLTFGLAFTYTFIWADVHPGYPDSVTHLTVAVMLLSNNPITAAIMVIIGGMNDERIVLALPFLFLWHQEINDLRTFVSKSWKFGIGIITGMLALLLIRHSLSAGWIGQGFATPLIYKDFLHCLTTFSPTIGWGPYVMNIWFSFRYLWFIPLLFLISKDCSLSTKSIYGLAFLFNFISMLMIADIPKGVCFAYPAILVAAASLYKLNEKRVKKLCDLCVFLAVITPNVFMFSNGDLCWDRPLPIVLIQTWDNIDILSPAIRAKYPLLNHIQP